MSSLFGEPMVIPYYPGDTFPITITLTDPRTGAAFDGTGFTWTFCVKEAEDDADADALWFLTSTAGEITTADATTGVYDIEPSAAESAALEPNKTYFAELVGRDADGRPLTIQTGHLVTGRRITVTPAS